MEVKAEKSANISDPTRRIPIPCGRNPANGPVNTSAARAMADTIIIIPLIVPAIMSGIILENLDSGTMNHFMLAPQMMKNLQYLGIFEGNSTNPMLFDNFQLFVKFGTSGGYQKVGISHNTPGNEEISRST